MCNTQQSFTCHMMVKVINPRTAFTVQMQHSDAWQHSPLLTQSCYSNPPIHNTDLMDDLFPVVVSKYFN